MKCLKVDLNIVNENKKLEEMTMLQNELLHFCIENNFLIQEKKLNANRDANIKRLEDGAPLSFSNGESL